MRPKRPAPPKPEVWCDDCGYVGPMSGHHCSHAMEKIVISGGVIIGIVFIVLIVCMFIGV